MQSVDHLRIKAGGQLDSHTSREEHEIKISQISLSVPWDLVFLNYGSKNWVRGPSGASRRFEETHGDFK